MHHVLNECVKQSRAPECGLIIFEPVILELELGRTRKREEREHTGSDVYFRIEEIFFRLFILLQNRLIVTQVLWSGGRPRSYNSFRLHHNKSIIQLF